MRDAALSPEGLTRLTTEGMLEMRGLLTSSDCEALAPPNSIVWDTEEPDNPTRRWQHTPEFQLGVAVNGVNPNLQGFLIGFRELVQSNAASANIPELKTWGNSPFGNYPTELLGFQRSVYGAKWHRTPASHEIGWHTDDTHDQADPSIRGEFGVRALGLMVAISLTKHGGIYEYAPAGTETNSDGSPCDLSVIRRIEGIGQGDAIGFCTARTPEGEVWDGSFPLHRFVADEVSDESLDGVVGRDSLVVYFRDVSDRTFSDVGLSGLMRSVKSKLLRR